MKDFNEMGAYAVLDRAYNKGVLKYFPTPKRAIKDLMDEHLANSAFNIYNENGSQIPVGGFHFGFKSNCTKQPPSKESIAITKFYHISWDDQKAIGKAEFNLRVAVGAASQNATGEDVKTDKRKKFSEMQSFAFKKRGDGNKWTFCDRVMSAIECSIFNDLADQNFRVQRGRMIVGCDWSVYAADPNCRSIPKNGKPVCERYYKISDRHRYKIEIAYMELMLAFDNMNKNLFEGDS